MKVVIMHHPEGDFVAIVNDLPASVPHSEVDSTDSTGLIYKDLKHSTDLKCIFSDVLAMYGLRTNKENVSSN